MVETYKSNFFEDINQDHVFSYVVSSCAQYLLMFLTIFCFRISNLKARTHNNLHLLGYMVALILFVVEPEVVVDVHSFIHFLLS